MSVSEAERVYAALRQNPKLLNRLRRLTYRCERRHMLLDVVETPGGLVVHQPDYREAKARSFATSTPAARERHTVNGENAWRGNTSLIESTALGAAPQQGSLRVACSNLAFDLASVEFWTDWDARRGEVVVPARRAGRS